MKKLFIFAVLSLLMIGCTDDEPISVPNAMEQSAKENEHRVSLQDALKRAESLLSQIGDPATRSKTRKVKSVEYLQNQLTRSGAIDTTLYLVNYENNAGFALLGADDRVRPIYAISDEGRLNMEDTVENKGLAMFFRNTETDVASLLGGGIQIDTTIVQPPIDPGIPTVEYIVARQTEPLLNYYQNRWNQQPPFNTYCPIIDGSHAVVGCVAVAISQIMAFHEWPRMIDREFYNWSVINSGQDYNGLALLLKRLGNPENLNMNYGINTSSALISNVQRTFVNMGYINPGNYLSFNEEAIITILEKGEIKQSGGGPVYVDGRNPLGGHAWVIDGYLQYDKVINNVLYESQDILFHCIWGFWAGTNNGYYYWSKTESLGGQPEEYADIDRGITSDNAVNYTNIIYLQGLIPNR